LSATALSLVLAAAVLHATWNALVKSASDRAITLAGVAAMHAVGGALLLFFGEMPSGWGWAMIIVSTLVHYLYYYLMFQAYRIGDLSQVYPIARGMAPALVALGAFLFIGETLTGLGWAGLALVTAGIGILALQRGASHADPRAVMMAVMLGLSISAYSVADGLGVRWAGDPIGYMGWLFLLEAPVPLWILTRRLRSGGSFDSRVFMIGLLGGLFSVTAYGVVLYAKTIAHIGAVSAVRESSVIIAALIGVFFLGERPWMGRMIAATVVACGVVLLAIGG